MTAGSRYRRQVSRARDAIYSLGIILSRRLCIDPPALRCEKVEVMRCNTMNGIPTTFTNPEAIRPLVSNSILTISWKPLAPLLPSMCSSPIWLYRTIRVAVRQLDGALMMTEGREQQLLYIQQDGTIGGTGNVAMYLMQDEMINIREEIIRFSTHPASIERPDEEQTSEIHIPMAAVAVRMGPSGRAVGIATQTLVAGHGSPMTYIINIDIAKNDLIVVFQPDDLTLAPVLSQVFTRPPLGWDTEAAQLNTCYTNDPFSMSDRNNTWGSGLSTFQSETGRQSCVSYQYPSPYADNPSPASESTPRLGSEDQSSTQLVNMDEAGTQHDAIDDLCIVVKLRP
ncbi:uncharacterized protein CLUP02_04710 [Colletotrichum lupini]|uniref:Uncharacterized protein n=1 Tax=Colletotrichum lupini TaxID=145971 RepID=A0A9Q8SKU7_9PEZI|nr:uncharacterized protein CLUP02_04710 [Colletotrichum lupini]UQC79231.1 hypothetical protein CLUP02_04710 [Colletotrichum lupini]